MKVLKIAWSPVEVKGELVTNSVALMHYAAKKDPENVPLELRKLLQQCTHV